MRVFISFVRVRLEQERDSLRGLVLALGYEPVMFKDFTAQPVPSRQVCLEGVRSCDVYLLLLGDRYGHEFRETGLSPTAVEHDAARPAGIPRLVTRKTGGTPELKQRELIEESESYRDGVFYSEFTDVVDLQAKVAAAVRQAERAPRVPDVRSAAQRRARQLALELAREATGPGRRRRPGATRAASHAAAGALPDPAIAAPRLATELRSAGGALKQRSTRSRVAGARPPGSVATRPNVRT